VPQVYELKHYIITAINHTRGTHKTKSTITDKRKKNKNKVTQQTDKKSAHTVRKQYSTVKISLACFISIVFCVFIVFYFAI